MVVIAASGLMGCPRPVRFDPPPDFATLDRGVREQFGDLAAEVDERPSDPWAWGRLGMWFDVYAYPTSAAACYDRAMTLAPNEPRWPYLRGTVAEQSGQLAQAVELYRRSEDLGAEDPEPALRLAAIAAAERPSEALELYRGLVARWPQNAEARFGLARAAFEAGDLPHAQALLEALLEEQPQATPVLYQLAAVLRSAGEPERGAALLSAVPADNLEHQPVRSDSFWQKELRAVDRGSRRFARLGVLAHRRGQPHEALRWFALARESDPDGVEDRLNYGAALREVGRGAEAERELRAALEMAAKGSELANRVSLELARALTASRPRQAEKLLLGVVAADPGSIAARLELAKLYTRFRDFSQARAQYEQLEALSAPIPELTFWHAAMLCLEGRCGGARRLLEAAREQGRGTRASDLLLARTLVLEEPAAGGRAWDLAWDRRLPVDALAAESLAFVAAANGDFAAARHWQDTAAELAAAAPKVVRHRVHRRQELYRQGLVPSVPLEIGEGPAAGMEGES